MMRMIGGALLLGLVGACSKQAEDTASELPREVLSESGDLQVSWTSDPDPLPPSETFAIVVAFADSESGGPDGSVQDLALQVTMPDHDHGMTVEPQVVDLGEGRWEASPMKFHMTGYWEMALTWTVDGVEDSALFGIDCCEAPE